MTESKVIATPTGLALQVNGKEIIPAAYITYLEERGTYKEFTDAGYKLFSVNIMMVEKGISISRSLAPLAKGIFDDPDTPDFTTADETVRRVLRACPDAYILPRVSISMPHWWEEKHPDHCVKNPDGSILRESLVTDKFREDAAAMLRTYMRHVLTSDYADHIVGWQLSGGNTQEWFHYDFQRGALCPAADEAYTKWRAEKGLGPAKLPDLEHMKHRHVSDEEQRLALRFASEAVAETVAHFAAVAKEECQRRQVVGTFYGYCMEVSDPRWGTHDLARLLRDDNVDFFCSPCSYNGLRQPGYDWGDMRPLESILHHGKLPLTECDVRTCLTRPIEECRPGMDPTRSYVGGVWEGPADMDTTRVLLRNAFARQITHGCGLWWFDMWGGWYNDPAMLRDLALYRRLYGKRQPWDGPEVALYVDETMYSRLPVMGSAGAARKPMGFIGAPYATYLLSDFDETYQNHKAVVFAIPEDSDGRRAALAACEAAGIPAYTCTLEEPVLTTEALRPFLKDAGVFCYCDTDDVVYVGYGFVAIHAATAGEKVVNLPHTYRVTNVYGGKHADTNRIVREMAQHETLLYRLEDMGEK